MGKSNRVSEEYLIILCAEAQKAGGRVSTVVEWLNMTLREFITEMAEPNNLVIRWEEPKKPKKIDYRGEEDEAEEDEAEEDEEEDEEEGSLINTNRKRPLRLPPTPAQVAEEDKDWLSNDKF